MKRISADNLLSDERSGALTTALFVTLALSIIVIFVNILYLNKETANDKDYISHAGELRVLSQRVANSAAESASGKRDAFELLRVARDDFQVRWDYLNNGDADSNLPPAPAEVDAEMDRVSRAWTSMRKHAGIILDSEATVMSLHSVASTLTETIPQLQVEYEEVVDILLSSGAP